MKINCSQCNKETNVFPYLIRNLKNHFCSKNCFILHRSLNNPATRLEVRSKMSKSAIKRGRLSYQDGRIFKDYFCKDCGRQITFHAALYGEGRCKKCSHKGIRNCNFGKTILIKFCKYNKKFFKSSYEANFAKWCDGSGIKWQYEPKAFYLILNNNKTSYTPDFYLPEFNCYVELKGFWRKDAQDKINKFMELYPEINFKLFERNDLLEYGVINR